VREIEEYLVRREGNRGIFSKKMWKMRHKMSKREGKGGNKRNK
jgi:hypothetical protein